MRIQEKEIESRILLSIIKIYGNMMLSQKDREGDDANVRCIF